MYLKFDTSNNIYKNMFNLAVGITPDVGPAMDIY